MEAAPRSRPPHAFDSSDRARGPRPSWLDCSRPGWWFTQETKGNVANIAGSGILTEGRTVKASDPFGIVVAPDGDPWYTMMRDNKIATLQLP